jgi:hypothetical protein
MPEDLIDGHDYPALTPELKRKILGENMAKLHNIDIEEKKKRLQNDEWSQRRALGKEEPWSSHRRRVNTPGFQYPGYVP